MASAMAKDTVSQPSSMPQASSTLPELEGLSTATSRIDISKVAATSSGNKTLLYLFRKDLRVSDNPILRHLIETSDHGFTHLLPIYVVPPHQIEVSGFIPGSDNGKDTDRTKPSSPYPEARSREGGFWRCGPHRAKFIAETVWELKTSLDALESDLVLRVGHYDEVVRSMGEGLRKQGLTVAAVWMTLEEGTEERDDERKVEEACRSIGADAKFWADEKFFIDDRDLTLASSQDLPDIFTTYRKSMEPLHSRPRQMVAAPAAHALPPILPTIPPQELPFVIPKTMQGLVDAMIKPVQCFLPPLSQEQANSLTDPRGIAGTSGKGGWQDEYPHKPQVGPLLIPSGAETAHPFHGGEGPAHARLRHVILSGVAGAYKATRNGLLGADFSTKLSAYLSLGCLTARQVHWALIGYEKGDWDWEKWGQATGLAGMWADDNEKWRHIGRTGGMTEDVYPTALVEEPEDMKTVEGYGAGENEGTAAVRFELLWRDYMRLCSRKFGAKLFALGGFRRDKMRWKRLDGSTTGSGSETGAVSTTRDEKEVAKTDAAVGVGATNTFKTSPPLGPSRRYSPTGGTNPVLGDNNRAVRISAKLSSALPPPVLAAQPIAHLLHRCLHGTTGHSLIDASARELLHTGYTSNRTRQNFASFLAKHLGIDWRLGAEWYECCLIDYDVSSNWANWQYVAGVGNDPRGEARIFNPVKQGFGYDAQGRYVGAWVLEVRGLFEGGWSPTGTGGVSPSVAGSGIKKQEKVGGEGGEKAKGQGGKKEDQVNQEGEEKETEDEGPMRGLENVMQPSIVAKSEWKGLGWEEATWDRREMWEKPVPKIDFRVEGKPGRGRKAFRRRGGLSRGGGKGGRMGRDRTMSADGSFSEEVTGWGSTNRIGSRATRGRGRVGRGGGGFRGGGGGGQRDNVSPPQSSHSSSTAGVTPSMSRGSVSSEQSRFPAGPRRWGHTGGQDVQAGTGYGPRGRGPGLGGRGGSGGRGGGFVLGNPPPPGWGYQGGGRNGPTALGGPPSGPAGYRGGVGRGGYNMAASGPPYITIQEQQGQSQGHGGGQYVPPHMGPGSGPRSGPGGGVIGGGHGGGAPFGGFGGSSGGVSPGGRGAGQLLGDRGMVRLGWGHAAGGTRGSMGGGGGGGYGGAVGGGNDGGTGTRW